MLIDSHAHLDMEDFQQDLPMVLNRAIQGGVCQVITIGIDLASSKKALDIAKAHHFVFATVGCHPHNADRLENGDLDRMAELAAGSKVVGWGEIGLDFHRNHSSREGQMRAFEAQLEIAAHLDLPVVIHDRDAHDEVLAMLQSMGKSRPRGVIHCFSGDYALAEAFMELGYYISIPGTVTFPKAHAVKEAAARIPLDRLLVETDAPFLAPAPKRGKRNEPALVYYTAKEIANLRDTSFDEVARRTAANTRMLFAMPEPTP